MRFQKSTRRAFLLDVSAAALAARAQTAGNHNKVWAGAWICVPDTPATEYGVYHFRHSFELAQKPERFVVDLTADQRYELFVNGRRVGWGPARGDRMHWRYETFDLAPFLGAGRNVLAAVVWNFGELAPQAQISLETGFVLHGIGQGAQGVSTGRTWKCLRNRAYQPIRVTSSDARGYYVAGPGDHVGAAAYPWGWETRDFDDSKWQAAEIVGPAAEREARDVHTRWMLMPRTIPAMEERPERLQRLRSATGIAAPAQFPARQEPLHVPANTRAVLLLDQTYLTTAYPELMVSGGRGATVRLRYAESLLERVAGAEKGNRDEVEGKQFIGYRDEFLPDGGAHRTFRPLWWRTYRYVELSVETKDDPLTIDDLTATYVGYPFQRRAQFDAREPELQRILDVGWRTARLCAHETYMDCPYYEQLQYVGDTRVQCLVSLFNSGDATLMRNAIDQINDSRQSDGCTMSRYPTRMEQFIPGFSLWWIGMVRDYWWYVDDPRFVRRMLPGVRDVLSFFEQHQKENGSLDGLPWWRYFDWAPNWQNGEPPQESDGSSAPFDLLLLLAFDWAAEMEAALGLPAMAEYYRGGARRLRDTAQGLYWDPARRFYADTPRKQKFSQHTNTLAVLADVIAGEPARDLLLRTLDQPDFAHAGLFFRFYIHCALAKAGEGDSYLDRLGDWHTMLARGLTTFAETVDTPGASSRSDCHAWSASPNIELFRNVLGVDSAAPGFARVAVRPHLGKLNFVSGVVPHPKGEVHVRLERSAAGLTAAVTLPSGVSGNFRWKGSEHPLSPGSNQFSAAG